MIGPPHVLKSCLRYLRWQGDFQLVLTIYLLLSVCYTAVHYPGVGGGVYDKSRYPTLQKGKEHKQYVWSGLIIAVSCCIQQQDGAIEVGRGPVVDER
jgi:hypothetical protein